MCSIMETFTIFLVFLSLAVRGLSGTTTSFNVMNYGAIGDGKTNDSPAFLKAWNDVCKSQSKVSVLIVPPRKSFLLKPLTFNGPCKSTNVYFQIAGNLVAPKSKSEWKGSRMDTWLRFSRVNGLLVAGGGTLDGRGSAWWPNACVGNPSSGTKCRAPAALIFYRCNRLVLKGLTHLNSPRVHIILTACNNAILTNLRIIAPETSPNTDGINLASSRGIKIRDSFIGTGDDCVAISGGSSKIDITGVACGPGHGISIGALGAHGEKDVVEEVHVRNCTLEGTLTGVRIKSWQGGIGYARKITFEKIRFIQANNPIIIDQFYCPSRVNCKNETSAIRISDVTYKGIIGTSTTDKVINLSCDQNFGCKNIVLDHVYISSPGKKAYAFCHNAHGRASHVKPRVKCLLP